MRAVSRKVAFEQDELGDVERWRAEAAVPFEKILYFMCPAPLPPGKRDVRVKGATLRLQANVLA
jgi:hypothetical protein